jgi:hypothetical protein
MSTPCHPAQPLPSCAGCVSYAPGVPHDAEQRVGMCMDATTVAVQGVCTLFQPMQRMPVVKSREQAWRGR